MKIIALHNVEIAGYGIVKRGEIIDYAKDRIDARIAANFLDASDDSRLKPTVRTDKDQPDLIEKTKEEMLAEQDAKRKELRKSYIDKLGLDGMKEQLAELGVPFTADLTEDKLADLLIDHLGE